MIRRINLYLFKHILAAFLFSGTAVAFVVLFTQTFFLLSFVIDNAGSVVVFFKLAGLVIPTFLPLIVPISLGIAVLFSYYKLFQDSEIVVLRAAGLSPLRMAAPALVMAFLIVGLGYTLTLWLTPLAQRTLVSLQYQIRDNHSARMIRPGTFNDLAKGVTFYARRRGPKGGMEDILVHDVRNPDVPVTIMAEGGRMLLDGGQPRVEVFRGRRQEFDVETGRLRELVFERYVLDLNLLKTNSSDRALAPREMTTGFLFRAWRGLEKTKQAEGKLRAEIHQRLAAPLLSFSFAAMAVSVVLAGPFNRRGAAKRIAGAGVAIIVVQAFMIALVNQVARQAWLVPALYLVVLAPWFVSLLFLDVRGTLARRLGRRS